MNRFIATAVFLMVSGCAMAQAPDDQKQERTWKVFMGLEVGSLTSSDSCIGSTDMWNFHLGVQRRAFGVELGIDDLGSSTSHCSNTRLQFSPNAVYLAAFGEKSFGRLSLVGKVGTAQIETDFSLSNPNNGTEIQSNRDTSSTLVGGGLGFALSKRFALTLSAVHYLKDPRDEDSGATTYRGGMKVAFN